MERLAPRFRVIAADLYDHGESGPRPQARLLSMEDEAVALEALLPAEPVHLVGHSYGAVVAMHIARRARVRVQSMALYEPALWGTLSHLCPGDAGTIEIEEIRDDTVRLVHAGLLAAAGERFIDYWAGAGTWSATPSQRRPKIMETVRLLGDGWHAVFAERWSAQALRSLDIPCLLLTGTRSTAAARRAVRLLRESLPRAAAVELEGLGHLGPITHPDLVNAAIEAFLAHGIGAVPAAALG
jgi:pimeloyl-ACP methyl ester carboxylesterase